MGWIKRNLMNCTDPRQHGKGLVPNRSEEWRYRMGEYRLIADINDETVTILMLDYGIIIIKHNFFRSILFNANHIKN
jgi:mRNA interferase RelE/StbE